MLQGELLRILMRKGFLCWTKLAEWACGRARRYCRSSKSISTAPSLLPSSVNSASAQRSKCVVFWLLLVYYLGVRGLGGGKEG